jgi:hypothetical protein
VVVQDDKSTYLPYKVRNPSGDVGWFGPEDLDLAEPRQSVTHLPFIMRTTVSS